MFFGGVLMAYAIYRNSYPEAFGFASQREEWKVGFFNTLVLLASSFTVVLGVYYAHKGESRKIVLWYLVTVALGLVFLGVKAYEYHHLFDVNLVPGAHFGDPHVDHDTGKTVDYFEDHAHFKRPAEIFFGLYFAMTGIHALHMIVGIGIFLYVAWMAHRGRFNDEYYNPVEMSGLYWHFVDIVWIFLYPLLYLVDRTTEYMH
jgi:cytochrome c oxidase subunit 3